MGESTPLRPAFFSGGGDEVLPIVELQAMSKKQVAQNEYSKGSKATVPVKDMYHAIVALEMENQVKRLIKYIIFFCVYLFVVVYIDVNSVNEQTIMIEDAFLDEEFEMSIETEDGGKSYSGHMFKKNFYDIMTFEEYWAWVDGPLMNTIYNNEYFNGDSYNGPKSNFVVGGGLSGVRVIGSIRFRMVAVQKNKRCAQIAGGNLGNNLANISVPCYGHYEGTNVEKDYTEFSNAYFEFRDDLTEFRGIPGYGGPYGSSGFVYSIPLRDENGTVTLDKAQKHVEYLKKNFWSYEGTRLLAVEFNVLGQNINNVLAVRFAVENLRGGRMMTSYRSYPIVNINVNATPFDTIVFICMIVFLGMLAAYIVAAIKSMKRQTYVLRSLYYDGWKALDILNLIMYVIVAVLLLYFRYHFNNDFFRTLVNDPEFNDVFIEGLTLNYVSIFNSVNIGVGFVKVFKYLRLQPRLTTMWDALFRSLSEVMALGVAIMIMTSAFAVFGHINFGYKVDNYHTLVKSFSTLSRAWMGEFNYDEVRDAEPRVAPYFYLFVVFFEFLFLLNMFIAIMTQYYDIVREEAKAKAKEIKSHNALMVITPMGGWWLHIKFWVLKKYYGRRCHIFSRSADGDKAKRMTGKNLRTIFRSQPVNWRVAEPDEFKKERQMFIKSRSIDLLNTLKRRSTNMLSKSELEILYQKPYKKLWWWAVHKISQMRIKENLNDTMTLKEKRKFFKKQVKKTRKFLEKEYGIDSYFSRNWSMIENESSALSSLSSRRQEITRIPSRIIIREVIKRAAKRQKKIYNRSIFKMFLKTWDRMTSRVTRAHESQGLAAALRVGY